MSDCSNWRGDRIKATVEREFGERRSGDSGAWSVTRETARTNAEIAETTERVDVPRTRRVRTCLSLSRKAIKSPESPRANLVRFLPSYEHCYTSIKLLSFNVTYFLSDNGTELVKPAVTSSAILQFWILLFICVYEFNKSDLSTIMYSLSDIAQ